MPKLSFKWYMTTTIKLQNHAVSNTKAISTWIILSCQTLKDTTCLLIKPNSLFLTWDTITTKSVISIIFVTFLFHIFLVLTALPHYFFFFFGVLVSWSYIIYSKAGEEQYLTNILLKFSHKEFYKLQNVS